MVVGILRRHQIAAPLCSSHPQLHMWEHSLCSQGVCQGQDSPRCSSMYVGTLQSEEASNAMVPREQDPAACLLAPCIVNRHPNAEGWTSRTALPFGMAAVAGSTYHAYCSFHKEGLQMKHAWCCGVPPLLQAHSGLPICVMLLVAASYPARQSSGKLQPDANAN